MTPPRHRLSREIAALVGAYFDVAFGSSSGLAEDLAVALGNASDVHRLRALTAIVEDPMPWLPFYRILVAVPEEHRTAVHAASLRRLRAAVVELLHEQGLSILRPEDVLLRGNPLERAAALAA